jgi:nucleoside-diphosphate-sugar epimerase
MLRVTLSGASGYIGSRIIKNLESKKVLLTALVNKKLIKSSVIKKKFSIDSKVQKNFFKKIYNPDVFVHLAWPDLNDHNSKKHFETEKRHYYFLKNLIDHGLKNLIVTGTCFEYGNKDIILKENLKIDKPITSYGIAKNNLRLRLLKLKKKKFFKFTWLRLFFVYGAEYKSKYQSNLWSDIVSCERKKKSFFYLTSGNQIRDYLHIDKISKYIVKIILKNKSFGIVNICSGNKVNLKNIVTMWKKKYNLKINFVFNKKKLKKNEPIKIIGSNLKLKKILSS